MKAPQIDPGHLTADDIAERRDAAMAYWSNKTLPAGTDQCGRYETRQPIAAEACNDTDEPCRPPLSRIGLSVILATGTPFLVVIISALLAWLT